MKTMCECCDENEVWVEAVVYGYRLCRACCLDTTCDTDGCRYTADQHLMWEDAMCERCQRHAIKISELDAMEREVRALADRHGWRVEFVSQAETGSLYYDLTRDVTDEAGEEDTETVKLRISDHGTAYCREDISLVIPSGNPSGDDHDIETLERRLAAR